MQTCDTILARPALSAERIGEGKLARQISGFCEYFFSGLLDDTQLARCWDDVCLSQFVRAVAQNQLPVAFTSPRTLSQKVISLISLEAA